MMIYELDEERIAKEFDEGQIQGFMKDLGFSRIETLIYLWAYNHFFTCVADVAKDNGRPMYRELARTFSKLLCVKDGGFATLGLIIVISGAKGLLEDLLHTCQFSEEDRDKIIRCINDLSTCIKKSHGNIDDSQGEIERLRKALKEIKTVSELLNYDGIACVCNKVLNSESEINE